MKSEDEPELSQDCILLDGNQTAVGSQHETADILLWNVICHTERHKNEHKRNKI